MTLFICKGCTNLYNRYGNTVLCKNCISIPSIRRRVGLKSEYRNSAPPKTKVPIDPRSVDVRQLNDLGWYTIHPDYDPNAEWIPYPIPSNDSNTSPVPKRNHTDVDSPTMPKPNKPKRQRIVADIVADDKPTFESEFTPMYQNNVGSSASLNGDVAQFPVPHVGVHFDGNSLTIPGIANLLSRWRVVVADDLYERSESFDDVSSKLEVCASLLAKEMRDVSVESKFLPADNTTEERLDAASRPYSELADGLCIRSLHSWDGKDKPHTIVSEKDEITRRLALYPMLKMIEDAAGKVQVPIDAMEPADVTLKKLELRSAIKCEGFLVHQVENQQFEMVPRALSTEPNDIHGLFCIKHGSPWPYWFNRDSTELSLCPKTTVETRREWLEMPKEKQSEVMRRLNFGPNEEDKLYEYLRGEHRRDHQSHLQYALDQVSDNTSWLQCHNNTTHQQAKTHTGLNDSMRMGQLILFRGNTSFYIPEADVPGMYILFRLAHPQLMEGKVVKPEAPIPTPEYNFTMLFKEFLPIRNLVLSTPGSQNNELTEDQVAAFQIALSHFGAFVKPIIIGCYPHSVDDTTKGLFLDAVFYHHGLRMAREVVEGKVVVDGKLRDPPADMANKPVGLLALPPEEGEEEGEQEQKHNLKSVYEEWKKTFFEGPQPQPAEIAWGLSVPFAGMRGDGRYAD